MKKILLSLVVASGLLLAQDNAMATALVSGMVTSTLNEQGHKLNIPIMKSTLKAYLEKTTLSEVQQKGIFYGTAALPTLLSGSKLADNLSGDTLRKGCEFLVSFDTQGNNIADNDKLMMVESCIVGYAGHLVSESEKAAK